MEVIINQRPDPVSRTPFHGPRFTSKYRTLIAGFSIDGLIQNNDVRVESNKLERPLRAT
jgi:hypothetical protein